MIRHITYTDQNMTRSADFCRITALENGCDTSTVYGEGDLRMDFVERNAAILGQARGCGYWIWKPQIILQEMENAEANDVIIYTDAGVEFINNVSHLLPAMNNFCLLFGSQYKHAEWCKGDVLRLLPEEKQGANQLQASAMLFKCTTKAVNFLHLWLGLCQQNGFIDDSPGNTLNPVFREHRHDQALLTTLQLLYDLPSHWWPANYLAGKFAYPKNEHTDNYPVIFHHHRKRNNEW